MKKPRGQEANGAELSARQERALQALLTGASVQEAAKNAHIGRTTLYRWLHNAAFCAAYQDAQEQPHGWTSHRLQNLAAKAIQALEQILDDDEALAPVKVEAARLALELALSNRDARDAAQQHVSLAVPPPELQPSASHAKLSRERGALSAHLTQNDPPHLLAGA